MVQVRKLYAMRLRPVSYTHLDVYKRQANERLRRRYYKMVLNKYKKHNVAKTAIARELACFMWGMMTDNIA